MKRFQFTLSVDSLEVARAARTQVRPNRLRERTRTSPPRAPGVATPPRRRLTRDRGSALYDRARVLVDLAVLIADGGEAIGDIDVLRHQPELFGRVASDTTVWRALDELGAVQLRRIAAARAKVRARTWHLFGGPPGARAAGRDIGTGVVVLDVDSTLLIAHSDKEGAAPTYKHSYRFHPILVICDNTGELSIRLRPCNAGRTRGRPILAEAIAQQPAGHRGRLPS